MEAKVEMGVVPSVRASSVALAVMLKRFFVFNGYFHVVVAENDGASATTFRNRRWHKRWWEKERVLVLLVKFHGGIFVCTYSSR